MGAGSCLHLSPSDSRLSTARQKSAHWNFDWDQMAPVPENIVSPIHPAPAALTKPSSSSPYLQSSKDALESLKAQSFNRYAGVQKPCIIAIGLTVHNAPVEMREKLAIPEAEWSRAINELVQFPHIEEAAVLSTCNRMELYIVGLSWHRAVREVEEWLSRSSGIAIDELRPHLFLYRGVDASQHLMHVAGGLDSLVLGEGQILAQVKQVYNVGQGSTGFGRQLTGLFKQALTAGKRVRSETNISSGSVSVSSAAAELALLKVPSHSFKGMRVCIIGAGKMATLLVKHLASKGCTSICIVNRSLPRAQALAEDFPEVDFEVQLMGELHRCVESCDVVFAASSSDEILIHKGHVEAMAACQGAGDGVRRFIDISVPRNIGADVNQLSTSAALYNVDDLLEVVSSNREERLRAAEEAEGLVNQEVVCFEAWKDSLGTVPTIKALRCKAEGIRSAEFSKAVSKLGDGMSRKQLAAVEELSKAIVNKLLHGPMSAMRCPSSAPSALQQTLSSMEALEHMFELADVDVGALAKK
eukprot:gene1990-33411_t